jgi:hypothetical protein
MGKREIPRRLCGCLYVCLPYTEMPNIDGNSFFHPLIQAFIMGRPHIMGEKEFLSKQCQAQSTWKVTKAGLRSLLC